jgi:hypothetical protein
MAAPIFPVKFRDETSGWPADCRSFTSNHDETSVWPAGIVPGLARIAADRPRVTHCRAAGPSIQNVMNPEKRAGARKRSWPTVEPERRQTVRKRRRAQVDQLSRQARAHGYAHKTLNLAVRAVFDCRRYLAAANESHAREAFGHATRQAGLWLDYEEGDE